MVSGSAVMCDGYIYQSQLSVWVFLDRPGSLMATGNAVNPSLAA